MDRKRSRENGTFIRSFLSALPAVLLTASVLTACATVPPVETLADGQTGKVHFRSTSVTAKQFLRGEKGNPVVISGTLRIPPAAAGRLLAVILVHGSTGVTHTYVDWARELNGMGVATFMLDAFTGRGVVSVQADQGLVTSQSMTVDVYRALELLSTHPRIDPSRIAVMGWSKGGLASLYGSLTRFRRMHGPTGVELAAYLSFYPWCNYTYIGEEQVSDRPIRIFHGTADERTPVAACREYVDRLRQVGNDAKIIVYPGAHHGFDVSGVDVFLVRAPNFAHCFVVERPGGELINPETGQAFTFNDTCLTTGGTVRYDARAHRQAVRDVEAFLKSTFKLSQ